MAVTYYESAKSPLDNTVVRPYRFISDSSTESTSNAVAIDDVTIPASPNFPPSESGASTSYYIFLDLDIYKTSTNSTNFAVYNVTQGRSLTVVDPSVGLSNYTCKFYSTTSERRNVLEVHVGSTSNQASDVLSLAGEFSASIINGEQYSTDRRIDYAYGTPFGTVQRNEYQIRTRTYPISGWNMNSDALLSFSFSESLDSAGDIIELQALINNDSTSNIIYYQLNGGGYAWIQLATTNAVTVSLTRSAGGLFDSTNFESTTISRGIVTIRYYST